MQYLQALNIVLDAAGYAPIASVTTPNRAADVARNALDAQRGLVLSGRPAYVRAVRTLTPDTDGVVYYPPDALSLDVCDLVPCEVTRRTINAIGGGPLGRSIKVIIWEDRPFDDLPAYACALIAYRAAAAQVSTASDPLRSQIINSNRVAAEAAYANAYLREFRVVIQRPQTSSAFGIAR